MLRILLSLIFLLSFGWAAAQPAIQWANVAGTQNFNDESLDMATDAEGNRYIVGYFAGDFTFDATVNTLSSGNNRTGAFVVKFDTAGTVLWQRSLGNNNSNLTGGARANGVAVTPTGDVVVVGLVTGEVAENGVENAQIDVTSDQLFVWRLAPDGTTVWLKSTDASTASASGAKVDFGANNDIYVAGTYVGTSVLNLDLDDNTNTDANLSGNGTQDLFVVRYNSAGAFQKAQRAVGNADESILDLDYTAADGGKVAIAGFTTSSGALGFDDDVAIDNLNFTSTGRNGFFVVYNDTLAFDYGIPVDNNQNQLGNGVHFDDNSGKLWAAGTVIPYGSVAFGDSTFTVTDGVGAEAPFVLLFDTDGTIELINVHSNNGNDRALGLDVDTDGNAYVSGWVRDTLDMGDGFEYKAVGGTDAFMMVVD